MRPGLVLALLAAVPWASATAQAPGTGQELVIPRASIQVDGELAEWPNSAASVALESPGQVLSGQREWTGREDLSATFRLAADANHLFLSGTVVDDHLPAESHRGIRADRIEVWLAAGADRSGSRQTEVRLALLPLEPNRPWAWLDAARGGAAAAPALAGVQVAARRISARSYQFEAAIPFHHLPGLAPGTLALGCNLLLRDAESSEPGGGAVLAWVHESTGSEPTLGTLRLAAPGPLLGPVEPVPFWTGESFADLQFLWVPVACAVLLFGLFRGWTRWRERIRHLRLAMLALGIGLLGLGLALPRLLAEQRAGSQRQHLDDALAKLRQTLDRLDPGTLTSYRGPSRDRALLDLLDGRRIVRQRTTRYRSLASLVPDQFGPGVRAIDDLPVRSYWLPLVAERPETFQFEPPLRGSQLHLVLGRPYLPNLPFVREVELPRLRLELDSAQAGKRELVIDVDRPFTDATTLGRDYAEVVVLPIKLDRELRGLAVSAPRGTDLRLVGLTLESSTGVLEPLALGSASLGGIPTDLRGPYPQDAGIELSPGGSATVVLPPGVDPPQKLWLFHRATYPGQPMANPGVKVAEVLLRFRGGRPPQRLLLEHQVSMFYEMARNNTRAEPPEGSPAAIGLSWIDDKKELHVNLVHPVADLPAGAELEAIELRNLAGYRMRFRSVVFGNEGSAAPQDPPDSPLLRDGMERWLPPELLQTWRDVELAIYRGERLSEVRASDRRDLLPALERRAPGAAITAADSVLQDGSRRLVLFAPLDGDGWDGAVLALARIDPDWTAASHTYSRLGLFLSLSATPLLLMLLSELLAVASSLRLRLMAVLTLASLAPLAALSVVLVRVLEAGHESDSRAALRAVVRSALGQLEDQKERVRSSARQWLRDLVALAVPRLQGVAEPERPAAVAALAAELQKLVAGQLPPEWRGGFLRLEWQVPGSVADEPLVLVAGDPRLGNLETPARLDPGVLMQGGVMSIGVRAEERTAAGLFALTAGRPLDGDLLSALAPGQGVVLSDVRGYPIAASAALGAASFVARPDPVAMQRWERALRSDLAEEKPLVEGMVAGGRRFVQGVAVLRDLQDTPRGLLVVLQPGQPAALDLPIGRVPVRGFFWLVGGSLVVLVGFLSFVVSHRIGRPIERLEQGALALSRGALDTRVVDEEAGQVGRLTRAFNRMADELQGRLLDLQALNRTMRDLAAQTDEAATLSVLHAFCTGHTAADLVRVVLLDGRSERLVVGAGGEPVPLQAPALARLLAHTGGEFSAVALRGRLQPPWTEVLPEARSAVGLPIVYAARTRGAVVFGFQRLEPLPVDLELLDTVVAQAALALERAELERLAVQDPATGTYTAEYFRRRVADEVSLAQQRNQRLVLVALALGSGDRRPRGLRRFLGHLREVLPGQALLCHEGGGRVLVLLPGFDRGGADALLARMEQAWAEMVRSLPENAVEEGRPIGVVVQFPDEAPSSELLFDALRARLEAMWTPGASSMESDEALHRAGVTAISPAMREVYATLRRVAPSDLPILFEGETGVGKEVLTNLLHSWSRRAGGPLVRVHCAALSETLLASELFGHEKGAFTGADRRKIGRFEQADGGTLFLDEVGEISLDVQVKLLRVLQEHEIDRVGGTEPVRVDVRVVAATNRDIAKLVAEGKFREDLYYRLQGLVVRVPPLRERKQEIGGLVEHFRREVVAAGQSQATTISTDAMDELFRHDWPGNIRELRNTVFRAMVMARSGVLQRRDVVLALTGAGSQAVPADAAALGRVEDGLGGGGGAAVVPAAVVQVAVPPQASGSSAPLAPPQGFARADKDPAEARAGESRVAAAASVGAETPGVGSLPERLQAALAWARQHGSIQTEDHMAAAGVSHRTALRDLQILVKNGHLVRVGSRRGATYRPS